MNNDLISREALKKAFESWKNMDDYYHDTDCNNIPFSEAYDLIDNAPAVELLIARGSNGVVIPATKQPGEWLWVGHDGDKLKWSCSSCGRGVENQENFCPNCGRPMKKEGGKRC